MKSLFTILIVDCITCIILLTGTEAGLVLYTKEHVRNFLKKESSCIKVFFNFFSM